MGFGVSIRRSTTSTCFEAQFAGKNGVHAPLDGKFFVFGTTASYFILLFFYLLVDGMAEAKPIKRLKNVLTTGNIWLYVLSLMKKNKEVYGYGLRDEIEKEFYFRPSKIMMYVVLYRLEEEGLVKSEFRERRRYYSLTNEGSRSMDEAKRYLELLSRRL